MRRALAALVCALAVVWAAPAEATPGPASAPEYWFDSWKVTSLWNAGARGQGVVIAEIDTGVNAALPELAGRVLPGADFGQTGDGRVDRDVKPFGHGTAMASIMVARPGVLGITGLAPDAKILPIVVPLRGTTEKPGPDKLAAAIRWAADHGAKIISMSLGDKRSPRTSTEPCPADEQAAVFHALRKGAVVVAAVGNTGPTTNAVEDPAACLGVVAVGAVDVSGTVADFSTRQPFVTLVAPGVGVPSLGRIPGQAFSGDGTSQATALAAATLALVWSRYPTESGHQVVARVLATLDARRVRPSPAYGYGLLDAYRAVTTPVAASAPNPVYAAAVPYLARDSAFARSGVRPPRPAAKPVGSTGNFAIGTAPAINSQVRLGIALAVAGLLVLIAGIVMRVRRPAHVAPPSVLPTAPPPTPPPPPGRPRPRPYL